MNKDAYGIDRTTHTTYSLLKAGLISRTGVPSNMSSPRTLSRRPATANTSRTDNPMGLGRLGEQMLKTPLISLL